jgi:hypothetical protein
VLVETTDPVLVQSMMSDEWCGRRIRVGRGEKLVG